MGLVGVNCILTLLKVKVNELSSIVLFEATFKLTLMGGCLEGIICISTLLGK